MTRLLVIILVLSLFACNSGDPLECMGDPGEIVRREIAVEPFDKIKVWAEADIILRQGEEQKVVIEGPERLVEQISFTMDESAWIFVSGTNHCGWVRKAGNPTIEITTPDLKRMWFKDFVNLTTPDTIRFPSFYINAHSTGDIDLKLNVKKFEIRCTYIATIKAAGKADEFKLHYIEDGRFLGEDFIARRINVVHEGSNDFYVYPVEKIYGSLSSTGNLIVLNKPDTFDVVANSWGRIIRSYD